MRIAESVKQLLRAPLRTLLFVVLLTLMGVFLCLSGGLWATAQKNIVDAEENFTTIAVPSLAAIRDMAGMQETSYFYSLSAMARSYKEQGEAQERFTQLLSQVRQAGLSSIGQPDTRRRVMAYAGEGASSLRPENVETESMARYHEPYDRVAYMATCTDVSYRRVLLQTFAGDDALDPLSSLYLNTWHVDMQSGLPVTSIRDPSAENEMVYVLRYAMRVDAILALQAQSPIQPEWLVIEIPTVIRTEGELAERLEEPLFAEGKSYLVLGRYITEGSAATGSVIGSDGKFSTNSRVQRSPWVGGMRLMPPDYEFGQDASLHSRYVLDDAIDYDRARAEVQGSIEDFLADPSNAYWADMVDNIRVTHHSVDVLTTDNLNSVYAFHQSQQNIISGREFTQQEYDEGANVCVVSDTFAKLNGLRLGDSLPLQFYPGRYWAKRYEDNALDNISLVQKPMLYEESLGMTEAAEYTIVGIYSGKTGKTFSRDWDAGDYGLTANTVLIPDRAVPTVEDVPSPLVEEGAAQPDANLYTLIIDNDSAQAFYDEMQESGYGRLFILKDQGYSSVVPGLIVIRNNAGLLLGICLVAWAAIVVLFLLLFVLRQRKEAGIMLSLGAGKRRTIRHCMVGVGVVALVSAMLSIAGALLLYDSAFDAALNMPTMDSTRIGLFSELPIAAGSDEDQLEKLKASFVPENAPLLATIIAGAQAAVICLAAYGVSRRIVRENPMEMVKGKEG